MKKGIIGVITFCVIFGTLTPVRAESTGQETAGIRTGAEEKEVSSEEIGLEIEEELPEEEGNVSQWMEPNSDEIIPDEKEGIHYGWYFKENVGWYYYNASGEKQNGWRKVDGIWYYLDPEKSGLMLAGCQSDIGGTGYCFDQSGAMQTGWKYIDGIWYYYDNSGAQLLGWQWIGGAWYYLDPEAETKGAMLSDCHKEIGGQEYAFAVSGAMITGWEKADGIWYYYGNYGKITGWSRINGEWYYLDPEAEVKGAMASGGWKVIDGAWYYLHESGAMATNWLNRGGWYYLGSDGAMKTGWQQVGDLWYYLYQENDPRGGVWGMMACNTEIDGYHVGFDGAWSYGLQYAKERLDAVGHSLWAAYSWSTNIPYVETSENASPGSEWFARYGFQNGYGDCYVKAATFCYMARVLGYEAHQMDGFVPQPNDAAAVHSWVEIVIDGSVYVFDPSFAQGTGRNGYQFTYGTPGTWIYSGYHRIN